MAKKFKKKLFVFWVIIISTVLIVYFKFQADITPEKISAFIKRTKNYILVTYLFISMIRGFFLIPSSPFVLAGTILFPENKIIVFLISMTGILSSSLCIYYFSEFLGFDVIFNKKYPGKLETIKSKLEKPTGIIFVILWSFFPLVPTDAVCYAAGLIKMNIIKFTLAVLTGEAILVSAYVWVGGNIPKLIFNS